MAGAVQGVAGSAARAAGGYLGASRRGLRRARVAGGGLSAPGRRSREPHGSRRASEGGRLGGDGALGWVAGERPNIIAFLPTPRPSSGFSLSPSPFSCLSCFSHHQLHSVPPFPLLPPLGSFFRLPLKRKENRW